MADRDNEENSSIAHSRVNLQSARRALVVTVGTSVCAIPVEHVRETMRALPIEPMPKPFAFMRGVSIVRGAPVPVVDLRALLAPNAVPIADGRFVTLAIGGRCAALLVDEVIGLRDIHASRIDALPALLQGAGAELIEAIGAADAHLLVVLHATRVVPDEVWVALGAAVEAS